MPRQALQPDGMATPKPPFSPVVISGDLVYTAGQVAHDAEGSLVAGGIEEQTRKTLENVRTCLEAGGCTLDDVMKVNAFLADLGDFEGYNSVYREVLRPALSGADERSGRATRRHSHRDRSGRSPRADDRARLRRVRPAAAGSQVAGGAHGWL